MGRARRGGEGTVVVEVEVEEAEVVEVLVMEV